MFKYALRITRELSEVVVWQATNNNPDGSGKDLNFMVGFYLLIYVIQKAESPDRPVRAQLRHTVPRTIFRITVLTIVEL